VARSPSDIHTDRDRADAPVFETVHKKGLLKRLIREHVVRYWPRFALALVLMTLVAGATAGLAKMMEPVLDEVFQAKDTAALPWVVGMIFGLFLVKGVANYGQVYVMEKVSQRIVDDIRKRLFAHLLTLDVAFFGRAATSELVSRILNDVMMLRQAVGKALTSAGKDTLTLVLLVGVMVWQDPVLAAIAFFAFPTAFYPIYRIGRRIRKVSANTQEQTASLLGTLNEIFTGIRVVFSYRMEEREQTRAARTIDDLGDLIFRAARIRALSHPIMETLGGVAIVVVIGYGGWAVIEGTRTTGELFSFITALLLAYEPLKRLFNVNAEIQQGIAAAERIYAFLDVTPAIADAADARPLAVAGGAIVLDDVHFRYDDATPALNGLSLAVPAGKRAALVGLSGAGKSTVLNLIPRFYDVTAGRVTIDGQDVRDVTLASLRDALALVSQEVMLFDDTVRANIAYGRPGASEAEIVAAARAASADDFIAALPNGYETQVGEAGARLSGGQRQRIAIARAILKDAPILLLDEATSALDSEAEHAVQDALDRLMVGRTTLVIAHRLSTVRTADVIYVIDKGRVIEQGTHDALVAKGGAYARLVELQMGASAMTVETALP